MEAKNLVNHQGNPLLELLIDSNFSYWFWWKLVGPDRSQYIKIMNRYRVFFSTLIRALFNTLIISLFKLYDTRRDTVNLNRVLKDIKRDKKLSPKELSKVEKNYEKAIYFWKKVKTLRHEYFAHLKFDYDEKSLYENAGIAPDEFKELIDLSMEVFNAFHYHYYGTRLELINPEEDIKRLFADLEK